VERRALDAQRQLPRAGDHQLPPVDLLVADRHDLAFKSGWLVPRGTI